MHIKPWQAEYRMYHSDELHRLRLLGFHIIYSPLMSRCAIYIEPEVGTNYEVKRDYVQKTIVMVSSCLQVPLSTYTVLPDSRNKALSNQQSLRYNTLLSVGYHCYMQFLIQLQLSELIWFHDKLQTFDYVYRQSPLVELYRNFWKR